MLFEAYREEAMKKSSVSERQKRIKESSHVEITNEDNDHYFLRYQGYCSFEFIPQGQTVNQAYCVEILKLLLEAVHRKRPEL
jgi:hypothetical protein